MSCDTAPHLCMYVHVRKSETMHACMHASIPTDSCIHVRQNSHVVI